MSAPEPDVASKESASSDEWFARYLLNAALLVVLLLAAIGVSLYLDRGRYLLDWSREPGAGFLICMVLCPILGIVTLCLAIYAGIRLFLRPRSFEHLLVRLTFLVAHVFVFVVCIDTISTTMGRVAKGFGEMAGGGSSFNLVQGRDFTGSQYDVRDGSPADSPSSPSRFGPGPGGPPMPGGGMGSR